MKWKTHGLQLLCVLALALSVTSAAFAADPPGHYPTAVTRSEDGSEIRKEYDLSAEEDPAGIPRADFDQDGYHYTLTDLLRQELPRHEERQHTETVSVPSQSKDMTAVLALLPQTREYASEDSFTGVLTLALDTVDIQVSGYGSSTRELTATRTYPGMADQDTQYIPKTIEDNGHSLTLQSIDWQADADGHFTAVAAYAGSVTGSYVKGYTVTASYTGTVSRTVCDKVRYVAIFHGVAVPEPEPTVEPEPAQTTGFSWPSLLATGGIAAAAGLGVGAALWFRRRKGGGMR